MATMEPNGRTTSASCAKYSFVCVVEKTASKPSIPSPFALSTSGSAAIDDAIHAECSSQR